ncbi:hypothetical protein ACWGTI_26115 [Mesorhizobium sp. ArgA1]
MKTRLALPMLAGVLLSACNAVAAQPQPKEQIIGRWESPEWHLNGQALYAQFTADGKLKYLDGWGHADWGDWMVLESGQLQITSSGQTRRCEVKFDSSNNASFTPASCFYGWQKVGDNIFLTKQ